VIKYIGSKRTLVSTILQQVRRFSSVRTVLDLFSGTARVGHALKGAGLRVLSNDHNAYAHALATCYVQADREDVLRDAERLVAELNALPGAEGYFTEVFCRRSRFFRPENGARIDAIREAIAGKGLAPELEAVLLVSLMEAADRVDSTTGLQMAYLKEWAPRAHDPLALRVPNVLARAAAGKGRAFSMDAHAAAEALEADLAYVDPPYNQHSYLGNYHVWETLVRWDKPPVYGVACKRIDCRERKSDFNSRRAFLGAMERLIALLRCKVLVVSFNDEGFLSREKMESLLRTRGRVSVVERDSKRYVGAQIGIYDPDGVKVGKVGRLRNKEFLFVVTPDEALFAGAEPARESHGDRLLFDGA
jgi:adenine-specific DNA-methyltransferase